MKKLLVIILLQCSTVLCYAQLRNFDKDGKKIKLESERVTVKIQKPTTAKNAMPAAILAGIGPAIDIGVTAVQSHLTARQESYTATYEGSTSEKDLLVGAERVYNLNLEKVIITRDTDPLDKKYSNASRITLQVEADGPVFRFKTEEIYMPHTKARLRKFGSTGKSVNLNITIKIDAIWKVFDEEAKEYKLESGCLGESSITISGIKPSETPYTEAYYSDWFKVIPPPSIEIKSEQRGTGWYSVKVTVQEANPYGVTSKKIAEFFKENSEDLTTLLKGFIPAEKEEEKKEGEGK